MNIVIKTLGCKANRYESDKIRDKFGDRFNVIDAQTKQLDKADIIIVNTCTVTHVADRKSRQAISNLKSQYPSAKVIVFGCGANTDKDGYAELPNVDYVIQEPQKLYDLLEKLSEKFVNTCKTESFNETRTRALIKIQDGCNNFCSYCIIPYARGREKSRLLKEIIEEINEKCEKGYKEVVLTGINIGMWKEGGKDLADLINDILDKTNIPRLRLSSIEPQNFSKKFLGLFKNPRFCHHLHISLQSGSDTILKSMRRHYDLALFEKMIDDLRIASPFISITTDVIVGFPGETDELFAETLEFVKKMKFSKIHIFPYSKRKGTLAANMPNQVPYDVKKQRCRQLAAIEKEMRLKFYKKNIGRSDNVLIEVIDENGVAGGFTSNYLRTRIQQKIDSDKTNTITNVVLNKVLGNCEIVGSLES